MYRFYWNGHWWSVSLTGITRPLANALTGAKKMAGAAASGRQLSAEQHTVYSTTLSVYLDTNSYLLLQTGLVGCAVLPVELEKDRTPPYPDENSKLELGPESSLPLLYLHTYLLHTFLKADFYGIFLCTFFSDGKLKFIFLISITHLCTWIWELHV